MGPGLTQQQENFFCALNFFACPLLNEIHKFTKNSGGCLLKEDAKIVKFF